MNSHADELRQLASWLAWQHEAGAVDAVLDGAGIERQHSVRQKSDAPPAAMPTPSLELSLFGSQATRSLPKVARRPETGDVANARRTAAACADLTSLQTALAAFDGCALKKTATRLCFADGNPNSRLVLVGEAPGAEEDRQGKPFVGPSGRLLDKMLATIGLTRDDFWITNCLFWRPPGNRTPSPQEVAICQPFLERALELVQPDTVLFVGGIAARTLLGLEEGVTRLRGKFRTWRPDWSNDAVETLVTFHSAYLLRNPAQKKLVWRDLLSLKQHLDLRRDEQGRPSGPH